MLGFIRISANRRIVERPLAAPDAMQRLGEWLAPPHVRVADPIRWSLREASAQNSSASRRRALSPPTRISPVLAMERGYALYSTDGDFGRFAGLR
jgi:hypothetical protein